MAKTNATPQEMRKAYERYMESTEGMEQMHAMHFYETHYGREAMMRMAKKPMTGTEAQTATARNAGLDWARIYKTYPTK